MMALKLLNKLLIGTAICGILSANFAVAKEIDTNTAQMQAMDKITGKVSVINVPVNGSVKFGSFSIVVRTCKTRPPEETPENFAFVDVVDNIDTENPVNIFRGWMMSSTPGLNSLQHPIYDVWLLKCIDTQVSKDKLLSAQQLKDRDAIRQIDNQDKVAEIREKEKISDISENKSLENQAILNPANADENVDLSKDVVLPNAEENISDDANKDDFPPLPRMDEGLLVDGAPKSLLNIPATPKHPEMPSSENTDKTEDGNNSPVNDDILQNDNNLSSSNSISEEKKDDNTADYPVSLDENNQLIDLEKFE